MHADLVLFNGNIYTQNPAQPRAQALAVRDGKIVYVGDDATARAMLRPDGEAADLRGSCVIPGLTDAHLHFMWYALSFQAVTVETPTREEALANVAERVACTPPGKWIRGRGWNHNVWDGKFPTAALLDRIAPLHPVTLDAKSGHALWVNSRALALARITADTPDPRGGQIVRDAHGQPTGVLLEEAMKLVQQIVPDPSADELAAAMRHALPLAHRAGLTGIHDFDTPLAFQAFQVLQQRGELTLRVNKNILVDYLADALRVGLRTGFGSDWLRVGNVKLFADGALGPRTALMLEGYTSAPDETGIATKNVAEMREIVRQASAGGLACAIHAIGDKANRDVLDIYAEGKGQEARGKRLRHRIEHVQVLHPADVGRFAELGVVASMQPVHATSDMLMAEHYWGQRCANAYALRSVLESGAVVALGSDCPVEVLDPLVGIHAAVTRRRADGSPGPDGWHPEQRLTVEQAVRGFTWGAAYAATMEDKLGSLEAGKLADMTILDQDIFAINPMEILNTRVVGTIVGGKFVWRT
jgi:hypothetical protein